MSFDRTTKTKKKVIQRKLIHIFSLSRCAPDRNKRRSTKGEREGEREKRYFSIALAVVILLNQRVNIRREREREEREEREKRC